MKKTKTSSIALAISLGSMSLLACGGGSSSDADETDDPEIDAGPDIDAEVVANCTDVTPGTFALGDNPGQFLFEVPVDLGTSGENYGQIELYEGFGKESFVGTFSLTESGQNDNYATCATCFLIYGLNAAADAIETTWFQSGGSATFTADPLTGALVGSVTDLAMIEVTINTETFTSTPVAGGSCVSLGSFELTTRPAEWSCDDAAYADGTTCDCECTAIDPDCSIVDAPVEGCLVDETCGAEGTCIPTCDVLGAVGCDVGFCGFATATLDLCQPADQLDPADIGAACDDADDLLYCGAGDGTIALGLCDSEVGTLCREACDSDDDCNKGQACEELVGYKGMCKTPIVADSCATATAIVLGVATAGTTVAGMNDYSQGFEAAACTGFAELGHDVVYSIDLAADQEITAALTTLDATYDMALALVGPGDADVCEERPVDCLIGSDVGVDGGAETFTFTATDAGTYYIIVDGFGLDEQGVFTLAVTTPAV